jgi:hypothetical protein
MKKITSKWPVAMAVASLGSTLIAHAQPHTDPWPMVEPNFVDRNRFWGGGRALFNVKAEFGHGAATDPGPAGQSGVDRTYDNGYVRVDDSGNAGGVTWNWGFVDLPGQPPSVSGNTLELRSTTSPAQGTSNVEKDDPQPGFEIGYGRVLTPTDRNTRFLFGLEGAFNMTWLDIENNETIAGTSQTTVDTYDLSGLPIIPSAPYTGSAPTPGGPLPLLLGDQPTSRTITSSATTVTEQAQLEGNLYGINLGPFIELPLSDVVSLQARGGLSAVLAEVDFDFTESISGGSTTSGAVSEDEWLFGGYAELRLTIAVARHVNVYLSGGYQHVEDFDITAGSQTVKLDLGSVITAGAGVIISF